MKKIGSPVSFRRYAGVLLLLMGGVSVLPCAAQEAEEEALYSLPEDTWALQFQVNSDVGLNPFQGSTISAKHQLSERKAYRLGLDLFARYDSRGQDDSELESNTTRQDIGLDFQLVRYPMPDRDIKLYYGAGPTASFLRQKNTSDLGDPEQSELHRRKSFGLLELQASWGLSGSCSVALA